MTRRRSTTLLAGACAVGVLVAAYGPIADAVRRQWLVAQLDSDDDAEWRAAAEALLARYASSAAQHVIETALRKAPDEVFDWQTKLFEALGLDVVRALPGYDAALASDSEATRRAAIRGLLAPMWQRSETVRVLERALGHEDHGVRWDAVYVLGQFGLAARDALSGLVRALDDPQPEIRYAALVVIERAANAIESPPAALTRLLDDVHPVVACEAATALEAFGERAAGFAPALAKALRRGDPVRAAAAEALRWIGDIPVSAWPVLRGALEGDVRWRGLGQDVLDVVRRGDDLPSDPRLRIVLSDSDARVALFPVLDRIGYSAREAEDLLWGYLRPSDGGTAMAAVVAIRELRLAAALEESTTTGGDRAVPAKALGVKEFHLDPAVHSAATLRLARIRPRPAGFSSDLLYVTENGPPDARATAALALVATDCDERALDRLMEALQDEGAQRIWQLIESWGWPGNRLPDVAASRLVEFTLGDVDYFQANAAERLLRAAAPLPDELTDRLMSALRTTGRTRHNAARVLGSCAPLTPRVRDALLDVVAAEANTLESRDLADLLESLERVRDVPFEVVAVVLSAVDRSRMSAGNAVLRVLARIPGMVGHAEVLERLRRHTYRAPGLLDDQYERDRSPDGLDTFGEALETLYWASSVAPSLEKDLVHALERPDECIRVLAAACLWRLHGARERYVSVLKSGLASLESVPFPAIPCARRHAVRAVSELGADAHMLADALKDSTDVYDPLLWLFVTEARWRVAGDLDVALFRRAVDECPFDQLPPGAPRASRGPFSHRFHEEQQATLVLTALLADCPAARAELEALREAEGVPASADPLEWLFARD